MAGVLYGIGVGPGDPELLTLKAARILREADIVAVPDKGSGEKTAMNIVAEHIAGKELMYCSTPMVRDRDVVDRAYEQIARDVITELDAGKTVAFITLGDPTIYSTYIYIHRKVLAQGYEALLVPGVPSFCAAAAALNIPLCEGSERLLIVPASHDTEDSFDVNSNKVFMKSGKAILELQEELRDRGLLGFASMVENCGMENERLFPNFEDLKDTAGYYSLVIVRDSKAV